MMRLFFIIALSFFSISPAFAKDDVDKIKDKAKDEFKDFFKDDLYQMLLGQWYESEKTCKGYIVNASEPEGTESKPSNPIKQKESVSEGEETFDKDKYGASYNVSCDDIKIDKDPESKEKCIRNSCRLPYCIISIKKTEDIPSYQEVFQSVYNQGTSDCYCCSNPSACLTGEFSGITALLRGAGVAGILGATAGDMSIQKNCDEMEKIQLAVGAMDAASSAKCAIKSSQCHKNFSSCSKKIEEMMSSEGNLGCVVAEDTLGLWKTKFETGKEERCGAIKSSAGKQLAQSMASFGGAAISNHCAGEYKDKKEDEVRDNSSPCSDIAFKSDVQSCQSHCKTSPDDPQCVDYCKLYPGDGACEGVCQVSSTPSSYSFCQASNKNCIDDPNGEGCQDGSSTEESDSYETVQLGSERLPSLASEGACDDPLGCESSDGLVLTPTGEAKSTGSMQYPGGGGGSSGGGAGGGLSGGGGGGEVAEAEEDGVDGQSEDYKDLLSGLSPKDNSGSGSGRSLSYRGSSNNSDGDSGFDLSKFLPKNKKKSAAGAVRKKSKIAGPDDNIFNALSSTVRVYCGDNQLQCN